MVGGLLLIDSGSIVIHHFGVIDVSILEALCSFVTRGGGHYWENGLGMVANDVVHDCMESTTTMSVRQSNY